MRLVCIERYLEGLLLVSTEYFRSWGTPLVWTTGSTIYLANSCPGLTEQHRDGGVQYY